MDVLGVFWLIGLTCIVPIIIVWFSTRRKMNEANKRTEIAMAALEKNPDMDIEELMEKLSPKKTKLFKEKLLGKLLWGVICIVAGLAVFGGGVYSMVAEIGYRDVNTIIMTIGGVIFAVGIALTVNYLAGRKLLAKEIESEEKENIHQQ